MTMALIAASAADSDKRIKRLGWVWKHERLPCGVMHRM